MEEELGVEEVMLAIVGGDRDAARGWTVEEGRCRGRDGARNRESEGRGGRRE